VSTFVIILSDCCPYIIASKWWCVVGAKTKHFFVTLFSYPHQATQVRRLRSMDPLARKIGNKNHNSRHEAFFHVRCVSRCVRCHPIKEKQLKRGFFRVNLGKLKTGFHLWLFCNACSCSNSNVFLLLRSERNVVYHC